MTSNNVDLQQTEDGHHRFVDAPAAPNIGERNAFRTGQLVELKSGGPVMTVQEFRSDDWVQVNWFIGGALQSDAFHWAMLKLAEPQEPK